MNLKVTFLILKVTFLILKVTFLILKVTFLILKVTFSILKVTFLILKVTFMNVKETFRILKATFRILKTTFRILKTILGRFSHIKGSLKAGILTTTFTVNMSQLNIVFEKLESNIHYSERFKTTEVNVHYAVDHNITPEAKVLGVQTELDEFFKTIVVDALQCVDADITDDDLISVMINSDQLLKPIYLSYQMISMFKSSGYTKALDKAHSSRSFLKEDLLHIRLNIVKQNKSYMKKL